MNAQTGSVLDQMRFVLHGSLISGDRPPGEKEAAQKLLDRLRQFV